MNAHPLHIAFENWRISEEGSQCHDASTLDIPDRQVYLANRLYRAFYAGVKSQYDIAGQPDKLRIVVFRVLAYRDRLPANLVDELQKALEA